MQKNELDKSFSMKEQDYHLNVYLFTQIMSWRKFFIVSTRAVKKPDFCFVQELLTDTIYAGLIEKLINPGQILSGLTKRLHQIKGKKVV